MYKTLISIVVLLLGCGAGYFAKAEHREDSGSHLALESATIMPLKAAAPSGKGQLQPSGGGSCG